MQRRFVLFSVLASIFCTAGDESRFVRDGKAEIQVWLSVKNPLAISALKRLGFEVVLDPPTSKMVIGRVPLEKLAAFAEMNLIRYIAPMTSN